MEIAIPLAAIALVALVLVGRRRRRCSRCD
jgi:MYXO-CTERM domain-containing protein